MVTLSVTDNIYREAMAPSGNIFDEAMRTARRTEDGQSTRASHASRQRNRAGRSVDNLDCMPRCAKGEGGVRSLARQRAQVIAKLKQLKLGLAFAATEPPARCGSEAPACPPHTTRGHLRRAAHLAETASP
jgi:hypothetical protein